MLIMSLKVASVLENINIVFDQLVHLSLEEQDSVLAHIISKIREIKRDQDIRAKEEQSYDPGLKCRANQTQRSLGSRLEETTQIFYYLDQNNQPISQSPTDSPDEKNGDYGKELEDAESTRVAKNMDLKSNQTQKLDPLEDPISPYVCADCGKGYQSQNGLKHHVSVSHSVVGAEIRCTEEGCSYSTFSQTLLRTHYNFHSKNAPFNCPLCKKDYLGGVQGMKQHMKIHSAQRDYKCEECGKLFINRSRLTYHIQNVHTEPNFHCDQCSKMFRSKVNFTRHLIIHTSDKPYSCPYCTYSGNHSANLTAHVRSVHKNPEFTTGKEDKSVKRERLAKDILKQKTSSSILSLLGSTPENKEDIAQNLGMNLFKEMTERGEIFQIRTETEKRNQKDGHQTILKPKTTPSQKTLIKDNIITVTNSDGVLVNAVVKVKKVKTNGDQVLHVCVK